MKAITISLMLLLVASLAVASEKSETVSYLSASRLGSFYISPFTLSMENKLEPYYLWGAGSSYRLGTHLAIQSHFTQSYNKIERDIRVCKRVIEIEDSYHSRVDVGLVIFF